MPFPDHRRREDAPRTARRGEIDKVDDEQEME
jgi:hypothetical protein